METMSTFRNRVAEQFHRNTRVGRQSIFGLNDPIPLHLRDDANLMFAGAVGRAYGPGGVVLLAINPGGGGDAYTRRTSADAVLYPRLQRLRDARDQEQVVAAFEEINDLFPSMMRSWNVWRIVRPCLDALGGDLGRAAYLNAVPYRTREDRTPVVAAKRASWEAVTAPSIEVLNPGVIIALGLKAGDVLERFYRGPARTFIVPRTNGDTYISPAAEKVLAMIRSA